MTPGRITAGASEPLGAVPTATGVNFAVLSTTAEAVEVCLFDADDVERRLVLPGRTGPVFHGHVAGIGAGARYGLRAHGPFQPEQGLRFDPGKLLVDPHAELLDAGFLLHPSLFAPPAQAADSAPYVPKAIVLPPAPPAAPPLVVPWDETVIYEAHVRGLTRLHPDVPEDIRGTFAALAHPAIVEHLKRLGVTTLELLPTAAWIDERHLPPLGLTNYWGYNPVAFAAPDPRLAPGGWAEVRAATAALAAAGIEVVLDVVYNHTGEGDELGPTLSLRGLDNPGYYRLRPDDPARYIDDSGTGNTLACDRAQTVRLVADAMRTWVRRGGVSGFRFDLASVLGRRPAGFDPEAALLAAIAQDPELRGLKLIAEPWDCGPGGHQLGRFPAAWGEWNDRFRDATRRFWRGDAGSLGELAGRLAGSADAFAAKRRPSRGVNFVTAHDGFTLADLTAYAHKHNEANGEHNRDGTDNNTSWNNGAEGPSDDPAIRAKRLADQRALLATLMLARGAPMLSMGAELGHSQGGNNNAYCQDGPIGWIDWKSADQSLAAFTGRLAAARLAHPALRDDRFLTGAAEDAPYPDVEWRNAEGAPPSPHEWDDPRGATLQMVLTAPDDRVAVLVHRGDAPETAVLPAPRDGHAWRRLLDSAGDGPELTLDDDTVALSPRSVVLLAEVESRKKPRRADDADVAALARAAGIAAEWWEIDGARHPVSPDTERALLAAMDLPAATPGQVRDSLWRLSADARAPLAPVQVVPEGAPIVVPVGGREGWLRVESETGAVNALPVTDGAASLPRLAAGRYRLESGGAEGLLIVAPETAFEPDALTLKTRLFGLSAQLYSLKRAGDQGVGDFTTLARLGDAASAAGAGFLALNPLHALFPAERERASPYHPSDRRFLDPLYLDLAQLPGAEAGPAGAALARLPAVDYPAVWALKAAALDRVLDHIETTGWEREAFEAFAAEEGDALAGFCAFQAIAEAHPGRTWRDWPEGLRTPASPAVADFAAAHKDQVRRHALTQWLCDRQLAEAASHMAGVGLCRDLAVGAAPDGAEAWAGQERLALAASIGAPPDPFSAQGQVWALPPPIPHRWRAEGYAGFAELVRANMRHAGALRIDHVLGLARLFWVPEGAQGKDGAYVAYPMHDLLGVLALESQRARTLVIGEDLGTVAEGLREGLKAARVYRYSALPFEREADGEFRPASLYPERALACVSTHDLPPLAGWWEGADIDERAQLGLIEPDALDRARAERRTEKASLLLALAEAGLGDAWTPEDAFDPTLAAAIHAYASASDSRLFAIQVDDLAGERVGVNLPGTDRERPNWRRKAGTPVETLGETALARAILARVAAERTASPSG